LAATHDADWHRNPHPVTAQESQQLIHMTHWLAIQSNDGIT
jgi:hypothetical protein